MLSKTIIIVCTPPRESPIINSIYYDVLAIAINLAQSKYVISVYISTYPGASLIFKIISIIVRS